MQIDWITVTAQIANFLVLVWLLQRFLYRPITNAMDRREQRIMARLREAEEKKNEAEDEARAYRDKRDALDQRRDLILADARATAEEERNLLEQDARREIESRRREWLRQLEGERKLFLDGVRRRSTEQFYALARRALDDLASADLEEEMALSFTRKLKELDKDIQEKISGDGDEPVDIRIRSRFELSANAKRQVTTALHQSFGEDANIEYETDEALSCGIMLKAGSQTITWNFDSYLEGLERAVDEQISGVLEPSLGDDVDR